jgi:hypothetical protein
MGLPQFLARLDVEKRQAEKKRREEQHQQILHESTPKTREPLWRFTEPGGTRSSAKNRTTQPRPILSPKQFGS